MILTTLYLAGAKNTDNWRARKGDLHRAFPLEVSMVPSSTLATAAFGEHLLCDGFSPGETICFGNLEFITDRFGSLSLSCLGMAQAPSSWVPPAAGHCSYSEP
jgi:hypothetical protein